MPTYTYECRRGHLTERVRPMSDSHKALRCDACNRYASLVVGHAPVAMVRNPAVPRRSRG